MPKPEIRGTCSNNRSSTACYTTSLAFKLRVQDIGTNGSAMGYNPKSDCCSTAHLPSLPALIIGQLCYVLVVSKPKPRTCQLRGHGSLAEIRPCLDFALDSTLDPKPSALNLKAIQLFVYRWMREGFQLPSGPAHYGEPKL